MAVTLGVAGYFLAIRKPQQVDPKGQGDSTIQQQRAALKDSSKGDVSLEGFKAGTIPSGDVGQTAGVTKTVSVCSPVGLWRHVRDADYRPTQLSPGADPKVQARQG